MKQDYSQIRRRQSPFIANVDAVGLRIEKFLSYLFVEDEEKLISDHQYLAASKELYDIHMPNGQGLIDLREGLWLFYHEKFFLEDRLSLTDAFLDFHFYQSDNKADFLAFVKESPDYFRLRYIYRKITPTELKLFRKKANDWVARKAELLKNAPEKREFTTDGRIKPMCDGKPVSIWDIEDFFMKRWARPKKLGQKVYILEAEQVKAFVHSYFHGSPNPVNKKKIKSNGTQKDILKAVDEFFCTWDTDTTGTHDYCYMLIDTFYEFKSYLNQKKGEYMVQELGKNFARYRNLK
jgi:hypothetical protein